LINLFFRLGFRSIGIGLGEGSDKQQALKEDFLGIDEKDLEADGFPKELVLSYPSVEDETNIKLYRDQSVVDGQVFISQNGIIRSKLTVNIQNRTQMNEQGIKYLN
jgi:hypothetical protein